MCNYSSNFKKEFKKIKYGTAISLSYFVYFKVSKKLKMFLCTQMLCLRIQNYAKNFSIWLKNEIFTHFSIVLNTSLSDATSKEQWLNQKNSKGCLFFFKVLISKHFQKRWFLEIHNIQKCSKSLLIELNMPFCTFAHVNWFICINEWLLSVALNYMLQIIIVLLVSAAGTVTTEQTQHIFNGSQQTRQLQLVDMLHIQEWAFSFPRPIR